MSVRCGLDHAPDVGSQSEHIATVTLHTEETMKNNVLYISSPSRRRRGIHIIAKFLITIFKIVTTVTFTLGCMGNMV